MLPVRTGRRARALIDADGSQQGAPPLRGHRAQPAELAFLGRPGDDIGI